MKKCICIATLFIFVSNLFSKEYDQIKTPNSPVIDTFFSNYIITDNYRWLEDTRNDSTIEWVNNQLKTSKKYLSKATFKSNSFSLIDKYSYTKYDNPVKKGNYYFTYAYYNNVSTPALFYQSRLNYEPEIIVDPNYISPKDMIMLKGYYVSKDSKLLAVQFNRNGSDWCEVMVYDLEHGSPLGDHLTGLKFSTIQWLNDGFFYSTIKQKGEFGKTIGQKVFYHRVGTKQEEDKLIFTRKNNHTSNFDFTTTSNERFFILKELNNEFSKFNIFYIDYESDQKAIKPLLVNFNQEIRIVDSHNGKFIAETIFESKSGNIVEIDPTNPYQWKQISPNFKDAQLLETIPYDDRIIAIYQTNDRPILTVIDYLGQLLYKLEFPIATSIDGFSGNSYDDEVLFSFKSYTIPPVLYTFNINTFTKELIKQTTITFNIEKIEYKEVEYYSYDSTKVSMTLIYEKGLKLNGDNPTILKAYGGFGAITQPSFNAGIVYFIKKGGIFAFAKIRGGGDKGTEWAQTGRGIYKQKSFDDFIAAAEYLINKKYTNRNKLAITGSSNGGLVVAASAIQRPELFRAVVPIVAPLDMLRFEKFTVGHLHIDEYGTVTDSISFMRLLGYSPYHNIKKDINYPSMLVITSENDDRVPPFHTYKFVAELQSRNAQKNPILLKSEKKSGHYGASTFYNTIKEKSDIFGFIVYELSKE